MTAVSKCRGGLTAVGATLSRCCLIAMFAGAWGLAGGCGADGDAGGRPNVLLILVDTLRADVINDPQGVYDTPNIDRLVADGACFTEALAHAPMTLPSHASLFSSRPPFETGVFNNGQEVPDELPMLAEWLSAHGYSTRAVISLGTLNLGSKSGVQRGFDTYDVEFWRMAKAPEVASRIRTQVSEMASDTSTFLFAHYCDPHEPYSAHETVDRRVRVFLDGEFLEEVPVTEGPKWSRTVSVDAGKHVLRLSSEDRFRIRHAGLQQAGRKLEGTWTEARRLTPTTQAQIEFESKSGDVDLLFWMNDALRKEESRARYALEVGYVDEYVGLLLQQLEEGGLYDDSVIVFTSDHGESLGEHGHVGHAQGLTDVQLRVPLVIKPPKGDPRLAALRAEADSLVPLMDVTPTILELVGLPPLRGQRGHSILEVHDTVLIAETHRPEARQDQVCLRDEAYKMIFFPEGDRFEMYDLSTDPEELVDVFSTSRSERPSWEQQLRTLAALAADRTLRIEDMSSELRGDLEALGYGGAGDGD